MTESYCSSAEKQNRGMKQVSQEEIELGQSFCGYN